MEERVAVDWKKLGKIVDNLKEKDSDEEEESWFRNQKGSSHYKKLKTLRKLSDKRIQVCEKSKRWWDDELLNQLKKTRRTRIGNGEEGINQEGRIKRWKAEKENIRTMVREKEKECWKRFYKENGEKDPWEVVKWAKDLWRIREGMKTLRDTNDNPLNTDEEKADSLIRDYFT